MFQNTCECSLHWGNSQFYLCHWHFLTSIDYRTTGTRAEKSSAPMPQQFTLSDWRTALQTDKPIHTRDMDVLHFVKCFQIHLSRRPGLKNRVSLLQAAADSAASQLVFKLFEYSRLGKGPVCLAASQADRSWKVLVAFVSSWLPVPTESKWFICFGLIWQVLLYDVAYNSTQEVLDLWQQRAWNFFWIKIFESHAYSPQNLVFNS